MSHSRDKGKKSTRAKRPKKHTLKEKRAAKRQAKIDETAAPWEKGR